MWNVRFGVSCRTLSQSRIWQSILYYGWSIGWLAAENMPSLSIWREDLICGLFPEKRIPRSRPETIKGTYSYGL